MNSVEYRRLTAAFNAMAEQSSHPDIRTRWRRLAQACQSFGKNPQSDLSEAEKVRSHKRSIGTRITSRLAVAWAAVHSSFELLVEPLATLL
jgi:hypothetical protein